MIQRIQQLVTELNSYRDSYYNSNQSIISDYEYDKLFDELLKLEKQSNYILSNSPTQTVGYEVSSKLKKIEHSIPLLSLNKTKSIEELNKFINKQDSLLMLKGDGLTVELIYENGSLIQASTRGNGIIGEEITLNAKCFKKLPIQINWGSKLKITGEAVIHKNDFDKINSKLSEEEKYATPRNLSAGSCRNLESKVCADRNIYFYAFALLESDIKFQTKSEQFQWLEEHGFVVIPYEILTDITTLDKSIINMKSLGEQNFIPIDGMVISYNNIKYSNSMGSTNHHKLDSIAYKFSDETEESVLRQVEWNTTRSSQINPTAIFDTVELDGTEVSRASLFNLTFIKDMGLYIGCRIKVSKRNMIIPYIEENIDQIKSNNIKLEIPNKCPSCGSETTIKNTGTANFLYCTNKNCSARLLDKFSHFVSRDGMNIEGLSEARLETFINKGWIKSFVDIYNLYQYESYFMELEGWGAKSFLKLIDAIEKSKNVKMENFIYALGIDQIGKGSSKRLAKYFNNDIYKFLKLSESPINFLNIPDFGNTSAQAIYEYFENNNCRNFDLAIRLLNYVQIIKPEEKQSNTINDNPFKNKKMYCTGTFANYKKEELKTMIESLGGEFTGGYTKSLDYLVVGSIKGSSKEDKAKQDGIKILSEDEFIKMIGGK